MAEDDDFSPELMRTIAIVMSYVDNLDDLKKIKYEIFNLCPPNVRVEFGPNIDKAAKKIFDDKLIKLWKEKTGIELKLYPVKAIQK